MTDLLLAIEFETDQKDLSGFSAYLKKINFPHRISEYNEGLALWVYHEPHVALVNELYHRYLEKTLPELDIHHEMNDQGIGQLVKYPITIIFIVLSVLGYFSIKFQWFYLIELFSFQGFEFSAGSVDINSPQIAIEQIINGDVWRLVTPIFLHFDLMHLAFNLTLLWFFGNQIEKIEGKISVLSYFVICACISNALQFYMAFENLFGGMSGVNYGLLGYCYLYNYLSKKAVYSYPPGLLVFAVIMMLLGFSGAFSLIGYSIANWAHLAGLLAGLIIALAGYAKNRSHVS